MWWRSGRVRRSAELAQNGAMEPGRLFESSDTDINAQGPLGVFPPVTVKQIVQVL